MAKPWSPEQERYFMNELRRLEEEDGLSRHKALGVVSRQLGRSFSACQNRFILINNREIEAAGFLKENGWSDELDEVLLQTIMPSYGLNGHITELVETASKRTGHSVSACYARWYIYVNTNKGNDKSVLYAKKRTLFLRIYREFRVKELEKIQAELDFLGNE